MNSIKPPPPQQQTTSGVEKKQEVTLATIVPSPCSCSCMKLKLVERSESNSSDSEQEEKSQAMKVGGKLVTVDGETELDIETLLKPSAYILGTSGSSIVYKAVLENGTAFAVGRIGESSVERLHEFESQVKMIAKLRHSNLVENRHFPFRRIWALEFGGK